ncbi:MAG: hypothetical protein DRO93_11000 [Candidatus Thorarchaeota archaeon]|nr:MAG: hypothetical protein DRO93_11000 [Candidatus Thorarchaeota archaeon]
MATRRCVTRSAVSVRHSGLQPALMRFLTAISRFNAGSLTSSESVNGSTSLPMESYIAVLVVSILSVLITYSSSDCCWFSSSLRTVRDQVHTGPSLVVPPFMPFETRM